MEEKVWKRTFRPDKRITLKQLNMFMTNSFKRVQFGKEHRDQNFCSGISIFTPPIKSIVRQDIGGWQNTLVRMDIKYIVDGLILVEPDILMANVFVQHALVHK